MCYKMYVLSNKEIELFVYFFSKMAPEKNPEGRKTELTTKKDCELVNKTIVGA